MVTLKIPVTRPCISPNELWPIPTTVFDPKSEWTEQLIEQARVDIDNFKIYAAHSDAVMRGCLNARITEPSK